MIFLYHKLSIEETIAALDVDLETGFSDKEARARMDQGERSKKGSSSFFKFAASAIARPVIYLLIIAAAFSAIFGTWFESLLIIAVIMLNVVLTAEFKRRGTNALEGSVNASVTHAIVLRNGAKMKLASDKLVVGDIVTIKPGRVVPADLRLISSQNLVIDETVLTGISRAEKDCDKVISGDVPLEMRHNCAFEGTVVVAGRGDGIVISTGMSTEMSRMTLPVDEPEKDESPVFSKIRESSKRITLIAALACVALFVIGTVKGRGLLDMILISLSLAVAVVPESAYAAAISALAKGARAMKERGFLPKSMDAVEELGIVSALCTELPKLGVAATYTSGRIRNPQEEDTVPFIDGLLLCELTNSSLAAFAATKCDAEKVREKFPKIGTLSGEVTTTLHRAGETTLSYTGGSVREIVSRSKLIWSFGRIHQITDIEIEEINDAVSLLTEEGYSLTAIGMRSGDDMPCDTDLIFLGIAATRAENSEATTPDTAALTEAGVSVYLLTSENAEKAKLGAAALGLSADNIISGRELSSLKESELCERLRDTFVFTALTPQNKVRIIHTLRTMGETVAVIGEELSDSPALDAADVGLSYAHSQDAAKNVSDVIYDGEYSADGAIYCGKSANLAIRKALVYLNAANIGEFICVFLGITLGFGFCLTPLQILLLNLITDTFPVMWLAGASKHKKEKNFAFIYITGIILGIIALALHKILIGIEVSEVLASWITFALLAVGELILAIPVYFSGRR